MGAHFQLSALLLGVLDRRPALAGWHGWLKPGPAATGRQADATSPVPPPLVDPIAAVGGTWGWKFNALLSCKENPHTIKLSDDRHTLSIHFHTPLPTPSGNADGYEYDIVRIEPNELVLALLAAPDFESPDAMGRPLEWAIHFEDKNAYYLPSAATRRHTGHRCDHPLRWHVVNHAQPWVSFRRAIGLRDPCRQPDMPGIALAPGIADSRDPPRLVRRIRVTQR